MRLLVTRPEPDGERTAAMLRARGHDVVCAPLLRVELISDADLGAGPWAAVLMTSANAARSVAGHDRFSELNKLPVLTVGGRTADTARRVGFINVEAAGLGVTDLARLAARRCAGAREPLLYLAGADRAGDLGAALAPHRIGVRTVVIYRAVSAGEFPADVAALLVSRGLDGVLHYSRRSAEAFIVCAGRADLSLASPNLDHYCLSAAVAAPLSAAGAGKVRIAAQPDESAMLRLIETA